jgi:hypothetical protein
MVASQSRLLSHGAFMSVRVCPPKPSLCLALALSPWLPGLLLTSSVAQADDNLGPKARFAVPMSCAAVALIRGAEYPETIRVYDEGHEARGAAEADRAVLGLSWRHRREFARKAATQAFTELYDRAPTEDELRNERSRWVHTLMGYSQPLRDAVRWNCQALFDLADASRRPGADGPP